MNTYLGQSTTTLHEIRIAARGAGAFAWRPLLVLLCLSLCAVRADAQSIVAWGNDPVGQVSTIPSATDFTAIEAGSDAGYALRPDGSIAAWGGNSDGQVSNTPSGTGFTAIAGGTNSEHVYALAADGSIAAWGSNSNGQVSNTPSGTGFTAITANEKYGCALRADGSIAAWGGNSFGVVANAPSGTGFTAISAGVICGSALRADGSIAVWGNIAPPPSGTGYTAISAGFDHAYALRADGSIAAWGLNNFSQVSGTPSGTGFTSIVAGSHSGFALRADGSIAAWGGNGLGFVPNAPSGTGFTAISVGSAHGYALTAPPPQNVILTLEADACQQDQDAVTPGVQVAYELWLRNPNAQDVTGYQAFLAFNDSAMTYVPGSSSYSATPLEVHIQNIATANVDTGELRLDGNTFGAGTAGDALLATLLFTVNECDSNTLAFDLTQAFISKASSLGAPFMTDLVDSSGVVGDDTDPVIATNANITQPADAGSCTQAVVSWTDPTATDICDPSVDVVCSPASGSIFLVGTTTVTCTATDDCGNTDTSTFDVTVTATNLIDVVVELSGSDPAMRCIQFITDCNVVTEVPMLDFVGSPATATATIEVPCGLFAKVCAKDEQHSMFADTTLTIVGNKYVVDATLVLEGGDTDNDGDVDIDDVTLFVGQFGTTVGPDSCPWDGTRNADFSNDGAVGTEDYAFLVANWLTMSACTCPLVYGGVDVVARGWMKSSVRVHNLQTQAADYTGDGRVDVEDVELFEQMHGFSGELSKRMRSMR